MFPAIQSKASLFARTGKLASIKRLGQSLLLGLGASVLAFSGNAYAAETIVLTYEQDTVTVTLDQLESFARTGEAERPEAQEFFQKFPRAAQVVQDLFNAEIYISEAFLEDALDSSIGEFVLTKLNDLVGSPSWRNDLQPLRTALIDSYEDNNRFTLLEVLANLPEETLNVNLNGLEPVYNDVKEFVERIYPALQVAKGFIQDLVCDCETAATTEDRGTGAGTGAGASESDTEDSTEDSDTSESGSPQSALPVGDRVAATENCNNSQATTAANTETPATAATPVTPLVTSASEPVKP